MPKKKVKYRGKDISRSHRNKLELPKYYFVEVETDSSKRFHNCLHLLALCSGTERTVLDYLLENMDDENYVTNNKVTRDNFNAFMRRLNLPEIKESTMHKIFSKLCKLELITTYKGKRGLYQINPLFFYSDGPESQREELIRKNLEAPHSEMLKKLRHKALKRKNYS